MPASGTLVLVLCIVGVLALGYPISLYLNARRGQGLGEIDLLRNAGRRARRPWGQEDDDLEELARRVEELKSKRE
jgi:hypothetical protein